MIDSIFNSNKMKPLLSLALLSILVFSNCNHKGENNSMSVNGTDHIEDTIVYKSEVIVDCMPFLILKMNPKCGYVAMADSVIPDKNDSIIAMCVEAAFTGELLKEFKSTNVAGDYVVNGKLKKGYKCKANTGFLATVNGVPFIASADKLQEWLISNHTDDFCMFQQVLLVHNGKNVYTGKPIKTTSKNIYRAACIMSDGNFAVIQSQETLSLGQFIRSLVNLGVSDALYLDMGTGWNYGWYRETRKDSPTGLFDYRTPYQTNWLLIKARDNN